MLLFALISLIFVHHAIGPTYAKFVLSISLKYTVLFFQLYVKTLFAFSLAVLVLPGEHLVLLANHDGQDDQLKSSFDGMCL